jgi:polar amino acid transport system substrate-binding protein
MNPCHATRRLRRAAEYLLATTVLVTMALPCRQTAAAEETPRPLRVVATPLASALEWTGDSPTGVMVDVWEDLAGRLGRPTEFVRAASFGKQLKTIMDGEADVALGPLAITEEREKQFDLTHPIFHSGLRIAVRQRTSSGLFDALESFLSWNLLKLCGTVLGLALVSGHLLWWFERRQNEKSFPGNYGRGLVEAIWWIACTIITGSCDDKHVDSLLGRLLAYAWMIGGIVLLATFTSLLTATITADRVVGTIHGPRDLAGQVVGCQAEAVSVAAVRQRGGIPEEFAGFREALDALSLGMVDAVVGENQQLMSLIGQPDRRDIKLVGPMFESFDFGIGLPAGSPLREDLNTAILRMREDGTFERIKGEWFGRHD